MAHKALGLEVVGPRRVAEGDDVHVTVRTTCRAPVEVVRAAVRWRRRTWRHERRHQVQLTTFTPGWGSPERHHDDRTLSEAALPALLGSHPTGPRPDVTVRMEVVDVAPSTLLVPHVEVSHLLEATVETVDGAVVTASQPIWVRPRTPSEATLTAGAPEPATVPRLTLTDSAVPLLAELYRPVEGTARLQAGHEPVPAGQLEVRLVCTARWEIHDLSRRWSGAAPTSFLARQRKQWRKEFTWDQVSTDREFTERTWPVARVATPALDGAQSASVAWAGRAPRVTAQTTGTEECAVDWHLAATWSAGPVTVPADVPVVVSMPSRPAPDDEPDAAGP